MGTKEKQNENKAARGRGLQMMRVGGNKDREGSSTLNLARAKENGSLIVADTHCNDLFKGSDC